LWISPYFQPHWSKEAGTLRQTPRLLTAALLRKSNVRLAKVRQKYRKERTTGGKGNPGRSKQKSREKKE